MPKWIKKNFRSKDFVASKSLNQRRQTIKSSQSRDQASKGA
jgi:hypothetical protein